MASKEEILKNAKDAILSCNADEAVKIAREALEAKLDPLEVVEKGFTVAMREVGDKFERGELFLPDVLMASDAMKEAVAILKPSIENAKKREKLGTVVIGTVEGDVHEIGKSIVSLMLQVSNFEVHDLGRDVPLEKFVEKAKEVNADIVGSSALMTTTMPAQRQLEQILKDAGIRAKVKTIVGGAPITETWAKKIGANGYAENAGEAVKRTQELMEG